MKKIVILILFFLTVLFIPKQSTFAACNCVSGSCLPGEYEGNSSVCPAGATRCCIIDTGGGGGGGGGGAVTNGACASTHYNCSAGGLGATAEYPTAEYPNFYAYQWWCNGTNGGSNVLCEERKKGFIQGRRVDAPSPIGESATITVNGVGNYSLPAHWNAYGTGEVLPIGSSYTVSSTAPAGSAVYHSICNNCIDHPDSSFEPGNTVTVTIPNIPAWYHTGFVDLYWKYELIPPTLTPIPPTATPIPPTATPIPTEGSGYPTGKCTCTSDYGACGNILGYTNIKYRSCTANPNGATTCTIVAGGYYDYVSCSDTPGCANKSRGDADCDDNLTLRDYFYYVSKKAGAVIPPTVNVDFNASGAVDDADRTIIVNSLLGR